jgi:hypothetical protein
MNRSIIFAFHSTNNYELWQTKLDAIIAQMGYSDSYAIFADSEHLIPTLLRIPGKDDILVITTTPDRPVRLIIEKHGHCQIWHVVSIPSILHPKLDNHVQRSMITWLTGRDLVNLSLVNRGFHDLIHDEWRLWNQVTAQDFMVSLKLTELKWSRNRPSRLFREYGRKPGEAYHRVITTWTWLDKSASAIYLRFEERKGLFREDGQLLTDIPASFHWSPESLGHLIKITQMWKRNEYARLCIIDDLMRKLGQYGPSQMINSILEIYYLSLIGNEKEWDYEDYKEKDGKEDQRLLSRLLTEWAGQDSWRQRIAKALNIEGIFRYFNECNPDAEIVKGILLHPRPSVKALVKSFLQQQSNACLESLEANLGDDLKIAFEEMMD